MSAKSELIDQCRLLELGAPEFEVRVTGPDHEPVFHAEVYADGRLLAEGQGRTKREAERVASEAALAALAEEELEEAGEAPDTGADDEAGQSELAGAWPIYAELLSQALVVTHERLPESAGIDELRSKTARLYTGLLADLGVAPEEEPEAG